MLTLYAVPVSLYCAKTRILLRHKRLRWDEVAPPGGYGSDTYKEIVASGNLPALVDGDLLIADSEAIAEYLEERYPAPSALPDDPADRARVRELSRFHDTRLEPELRKLFPHIRPDRQDRELSRQQGEALNARLGQLARLLDSRPAAGTALTLGDCGYPVTFLWMASLDPILGLDLVWPDAVTAYRDRVEALPAAAGELAEYQPRLLDWLAQQDG